MRLCATALATLLAGASFLGAEPVALKREDAWGEFLKRCEEKARPRGACPAPRVEKRLKGAVERLSQKDRAELKARLQRIFLKTQAWRRAEAMARRAAVTRRVIQALVPAARSFTDLRPAMEFILKLNGLAPEAQPRRGVMGKKGKMLI